MFRDHFFEAFQNRHRGSGRGFRIETVGAAAVRIGVPVNRRRVGIRAEHFDAGAAADLTDNRVLADDVLFASDAAGRVQIGPRGIILLKDFDVSTLQLRLRDLVAGDGPDSDARVVPQPENLILPGLAD